MSGRPELFARNWTRRLYRDSEHGLILGVCAGVGEAIGVRVVTLRVLAVLALVVFTVPAAVAYGLAAFLLPGKSLTYHGRSERQLWAGRRGRRIEA